MFNLSNRLPGGNLHGACSRSAPDGGASAPDRAPPARDERRAGPFRARDLLPRAGGGAPEGEWFDLWPKAAYWTEVESWQTLDGDRIEFTMRRLPSAD